MSEPKSPSLPVIMSSPPDEGPDYWERHIENWSQSGLSQSAYCRLHNLTYRTFRKWKTKFENYYPSRSSVKLVEVKRDFTGCPQPTIASSFAGGSYEASQGVEMGAGPGSRFNPNSSGIRFWCDEFCIEVDAQFSTTSLSHLIRTLQGLRVGDIGNLNEAATASSESGPESGSEPGSV